MPKITEERRTLRHRQILHAARKCFQRDGLHATTMDDIIQASGLSAGAVYGYFKSKDSLILAAVDECMSDLVGVLRPIFLGNPLAAPHEFVHQVLSAIEEFSIQDGVDLKRLALLGWSEAQRNDQLSESLQRYYEDIVIDLTRATEIWNETGMLQTRRGPREMAHALLAMFLGYVAQATILGDDAAQVAGRSLSELLAIATHQLA